MKERILQILRESGSEPISGEDLSRRLQVSRTAVWKHIKQLRAEGYDIESRTKAGYRLVAAPDYLYPAEIKQLLNTRSLGQEIRHFQKISTTNDMAKDLAIQGQAEGLLVIAEEQTVGKGRLGRQWVSPQGKGLWFSLLLRPLINPQEAPKLTVLAAVAVAQSIRKITGLPAQIKWPNDVLVEGKKVCGILTEMNAEMDRVNYIVVGIGINVNQTKEDFPIELTEIATSVAMAWGQTVKRIDLLTEILQNLDNLYYRFLQGDYGEAWEVWRQLSCTIGKNVMISGPNWQVKGLAVDIDQDGALEVVLPTGERKRFLSGEVSLRPI